MDDEVVSTFLAITGTEDTSKATSYLEMAAGNLEQAVSLYMDHSMTSGGGGGGGGGGISGNSAGGAGIGSSNPMMEDDVRAPDATQRMQLMDDGSGMGGLGGMSGGGAAAAAAYMPMMMDAMLEEQLQNTAFAAGPLRNVRDAINAAARADSNVRSSRSRNRNSNQMDADDDDDDDDDDDVEYEYDENEEDAMNEDTKTGEEASDSEEQNRHAAQLADMFAPPTHLTFREGGFEGARSMAKDSRRWLLVNIQRDSEFASHALNRDVWRDELVENLVREGFILWQAFDIAPEGRVYTERYKVYEFPHIGIIDPRTRRLLWKKEGWTQQNPMTAQEFSEIAMDFCSRHSFDKPPQAPRSGGAGITAPSSSASNNRVPKRAIENLSEEEQLQAAMRASLEDITEVDNKNSDTAMHTQNGEGHDNDNDEIEYVGSSTDSKPAAQETTKVDSPKKPSLLDELLAMPSEDEAGAGARIQIKMPDGKRTVRRFDPNLTVKSIYAFFAQNNDDAKGGREFILMAGYPQKDILEDIDKTIEECKLSGQAITVRWK